MRYLLVIGFSCDIFKKTPNTRIFVNENLIDEFNISQQQKNHYIAEKKFKENFYQLQPFADAEQINIFMKNLPTLKFYELEIDKKIKHLTIRINIANNDNNYSNGFMTRSTLIKLDLCCFFPLDSRLLLRLKNIRIKNMLTQNYAWYHASKNIYFDLLLNGISWSGEDKTNIVDPMLKNYWIGENGNFICNLEKKYGIFVSKTCKSYRHFFTWKIKYLLDKYQQYANQGNND